MNIALGRANPAKIDQVAIPTAARPAETARTAARFIEPGGPQEAAMGPTLVNAARSNSIVKERIGIQLPHAYSRKAFRSIA